MLDVPVEVCLECGQVLLSMATAKRLDQPFTRLLASRAESVPDALGPPITA
ncbi:MAG: hypothetical protein M3O70_11725 [Actinomycetota bacterium]|nr:hypothetical protein [Actinomycetota bacterium]